MTYVRNHIDLKNCFDWLNIQKAYVILCSSGMSLLTKKKRERENSKLVLKLYPYWETALDSNGL